MVTLFATSCHSKVLHPLGGLKWCNIYNNSPDYVQNGLVNEQTEFKKHGFTRNKTLRWKYDFSWNNANIDIVSTWQNWHTVDSSPCRFLLPAVPVHHYYYPEDIYPWFECDWCVITFSEEQAVALTGNYRLRKGQHHPQAVDEMSGENHKKVYTATIKTGLSLLRIDAHLNYMLTVFSSKVVLEKWHVPNFSELFCSSKRAVLWFQLL